MGRYGRQEMIRGWDQEAIGRARVLVVGAGTTGNEVIKNLALLGFGEITIVDDDLVNEVNLSRSVLFRDEDLGKSKSEIAASRARELNPNLRTTGLHCNAIYGIGNLEYADFDCVILTVDNLETRMWVNRYCWMNEKPLIDTGVDGLIGNIFTTNPPAGACIECGWDEREYSRLTDKYSCLKRGLTFNDPIIPMVVTSAAIVGGIAAQEAVRLLGETSRGNPAIDRKFYRYDAESGVFLTWRVPKKNDCPGHSDFVKNSHILLTVSVDEYVESVESNLLAVSSASACEIWHDKSIVYSVFCNHCGYRQCVVPSLLGQFRRNICPECHWLDLDIGECTERLRHGYSMRSLHVPSNHLLRVFLRQGEDVIEAAIATR